MSVALEFVNVSKHFGDKQALKNVSFEVKRGQIFGFLGPNGAGKTTSIRCLLDLIRPSAGYIKVNGLDSTRDAVALKKVIGYLPADGYYYDDWTAHEHIKFAARLHGVKPDSPLVKELDLDLHTKLNKLSTGNRQKLGIVLAFLGTPKILILDEPTRGLDPLLQNQLYDLLERYRAAGGTVFMSSHNLPEVERICDSIVVIRNGELVVEETLESLRHVNTHIVNAIFADHFDSKEFEDTRIELLRSTNESVSLRVKDNLDAVLHILAKHKLKDLEITHASLEDTFMELYK